MVFNFGVQRSGTLWLQRIVGAHPAVATVPSETALFSLGIGPLHERFHHGLRSSTTVDQTYVDRDVLLDATRDFCDAVLAGHLTEGARYLAERTTAHVTSVDLIAAVYPDARLVHIIRDGRDVARSLVAREWGPSTVAQAAEQWRSEVVAARSAAPAQGYREVRYEALLEDPRGSIADLYEWLGLEHSDAVLDEAVAEAGIRRNQDADDPAPRHGKWRDHFSAADLRAFEQVAGDLLQELGYERETAGASRAAGRGAGVRDRVAAAAARRGRAPRGRAPDGGIGEVGGALAGSQWLVDRLLGAIHEDRSGELSELVAPDARIRVVGSGEETSGRGPDGLRAAVSQDPAWRGRQLRGDMHPGVPTYSIVLTYELSDGMRADRVLELTIRERVAHAVTIYRPPLG
jgi:Sulfotransferase family